MGERNRENAHTPGGDAAVLNTPFLMAQETRSRLLLTGNRHWSALLVVKIKWLSARAGVSG